MAVLSLAGVVLASRVDLAGITLTAWLRPCLPCPPAGQAGHGLWGPQRCKRKHRQKHARFPEA